MSGPAPPSETTTRTPWAGWLFAISSTLAFSIAAPIATAVIQLGINPTTMLVARLGATTVLLGATIGLIEPAKLRIDSRGLLYAGTAGLANGVSMLTFYWSLTRLETSVAAMLFAVFPLVVLGLLALRGEPLTYRSLVRAAFGLAGVYLLLGPGGQVDWLGVVMVLVSVLGSSLQVVFIQWYLRDHDGATVTLYMTAGIAAAVTGWWLVQGVDVLVPGWQGWLAIGLMAIVSTYLARLAMFGAVRHLGSGQVALLVPLETLLTVVWSVLFLRERLSPLQWAGSGLIVMSALLAAERLRRIRRLRRWPRWRLWSRL